RYETVGGFVAPQALLGRYPTISIYGDGTVITEGPQITIFPGPALPSLVATKISEAGLQKILQLALQAGLLGRDGQFDGIGIAAAAQPAQRAADWPLAQPRATFGQGGGGGPGGGGPGALACGVVSGADLETLRPVLGRANQGTPWRSGGKLYSILVRVLLPDESGCPPPQV